MSWVWWPENSNGPEHEGWIQPLFHDGEEGTGTTCAEGMIQEARYDRDTGRETYRRVRPFSEVTHLRMKCDCGWTGITVALADMQGSLIDWKYREPTDAGEQRFLKEWHAHLAPLKATDEATCPTCGRGR